MARLSKVCKKLIREGLAVSFSGEAIRFTGKIDKTKLAEVERSYADAFDKRLIDRAAKEREAENKFRDFVVTY